MSEFTEIPVLDYTLLASPDTRQQFIAQLQNALLNVGFLYLSNPPIDDELSLSIKSYSREIFDRLSDEEKESIEMKNSPHFLGWSRQDNERTKGAVDHREQFDFGTEVPVRYNPDKDPPHHRLWGPNQWPLEESIPGFRESLELYMNKLSALSFEFLELLAEALELEKNAFEKFWGGEKDHLQHRLKIVKYPDFKYPEGDLGVGPHYDGWLTFLLQVDENIPGLQVQNVAGTWIDVPPIPNTFVVNIGKGIENATRGAAIATTHRVINPPPGSGSRHSVPFFQNVGLDVYLWKEALNVSERILKLKDERDRKGGIVTDSGNYVELKDLSSGEATLINRIRAHPDVGERHYPELYAKLVKK